MSNISPINEAIRVRISSLLRDGGVSIRSISRDAAETRRLTWQINNEGKTISAETIARILEVFPDVSAKWLLLGKGQKYEKSGDTPLINNNVHVEGGMNDSSSINAGVTNSLESEVAYLRQLVINLTKAT